MGHQAFSGAIFHGNFFSTNWIRIFQKILGHPLDFLEGIPLIFWRWLEKNVGPKLTKKSRRNMGDRVFPQKNRAVTWGLKDLKKAIVAGKGF